jgi:2-phospho-L-lactate guanylyltransferase
MDAGILAVKRPDQGKRRLGPDFTETERREIARALLDDALALLRGADMFDWWVASDDPQVLEEAAGLGFGSIGDPGDGLNPALFAAVERVRAAGADSVTILPGDLPLATPEDLVSILETGATSEVVIVPSGDGGTNALFMRPPGLIAPAFGERSLRGHLEAAEKERLRYSVLPLERMALDVDTAADATALIGWPEAASLSRAARLLVSLRPAEEPPG